MKTKQSLNVVFFSLLSIILEFWHSITSSYQRDYWEKNEKNNVYVSDLSLFAYFLR